MTGDPNEPKGFSLRRWSARKHEAARASAESTTVAASSDEAVDERIDAKRAPAASPAGGATMPVKGAATDVHAAPPVTVAGQRTASPDLPGRGLCELPSIDALTIDSDYSGFMQPGVDESLKRGALKKLFSDPRFNVMDGLDVYIDDYSKPDPIEPDLVRKLVQARYIFNPPATRVNAQGFVEDLPDAQLPQPQTDADAQALVDTGAGAVNVPASAAPQDESSAAARVPAVMNDDEKVAATDASFDAAALAEPRQT
jgi:hypothetical protein